jgi:hypothetical protein
MCRRRRVKHQRSTMTAMYGLRDRLLGDCMPCPHVTCIHVLIKMQGAACCTRPQEKGSMAYVGAALLYGVLA